MELGTARPTPLVLAPRLATTLLAGCPARRQLAHVIHVVNFQCCGATCLRRRMRATRSLPGPRAATAGKPLQTPSPEPRPLSGAHVAELLADHWPRLALALAAAAASSAGNLTIPLVAGALCERFVAGHTFSQCVSGGG